MLHYKVITINMRLKLFFISFVALLLAACQDTELTQGISESGFATTYDVVIDGLDQTVALPLAGTGSVVDVEVEEGDFLTGLPGGRLYAEQNDDGELRQGTIRVRLSDGSSRRLILAQRGTLHRPHNQRTHPAAGHRDGQQQRLRLHRGGAVL